MQLSDPNVALYEPGPEFQLGSSEQRHFRPGKFEPSWIVSGEPTPRSLPLTESADGLFSSGLWDCSAGQFRFYYDCDEVIHILEGEAIIEFAGKTHTLQRGDVAYFPRGATAVWTVPHYVRKLAVFHSQPLGLFARLRGQVKRFWNRMFA